MLAKFSLLDDYVNMWPLDILLGRQLKYGYEKSQKRENVQKKPATATCRH
jgi:hypothetical protein